MPRRIAYVTDVEGDLDLFRRSVSLSDVVGWGDEAQTRVVFRDASGTADTADMFVFGGDLFDKGSGDLRLADTLTAFKRAHPTRVFLIMGNRDVNKLRFTTELTSPPAIPFWDQKAPSFTDFTKDTSEVGRLKYLLEVTLGCKDSFEMRREELAVLGLGRGVAGAVSDADVLASFRDSVCPADGVREVLTTSVVLDYLELAQIAALIDGTLFCHGGLPSAAIRFVPSLDLAFTDKCGDVSAVQGTTLPETASLEEWVEHLNAWGHDAVVEHKMQQCSADRTPGSSLVAYQNSEASCNRGIMIESFYARGTVSVPHDVTKFLVENNVRRVCNGHKPIGDCPLVTHISLEGKGFELLLGDMQHANPGAKDGRSPVAYAITLSGADTHINGILMTSAKVCFNVRDTPHIGRNTSKGWVKAVLPEEGPEGQVFSLTKQTGRVFEHTLVSQAELSILLESA